MDVEQLSMMMNAVGVNPQNPLGSLNWVNLVIGTLFAFIGLVAFNHGRKERSWRPVVIGMVLMSYTFFVSDRILIVIIGVALTAALSFWKE